MPVLFLHWLLCLYISPELVLCPVSSVYKLSTNLQIMCFLLIESTLLKRPRMDQHRHVILVDQHSHVVLQQKRAWFLVHGGYLDKKPSRETSIHCKHNLWWWPAMLVFKLSFLSSYICWYSQYLPHSLSSANLAEIPFKIISFVPVLLPCGLRHSVFINIQ